MKVAASIYLDEVASMARPITWDPGHLEPVQSWEGVVVAVGFSGHGFKMASSLGAVAADLVAEGSTATDVGFMAPARFLPDTDGIDMLPLNAATGEEDKHS